MSEFLQFAFALLILYFLFDAWRRHAQIEDLASNMEAIRGELCSGVYAIESWRDAHGAFHLELKNPTTRIVLTSFNLREEFTANLFFKDSEKSGANITYASRHTVGGGNERLIEWERRNHLMGRMLYLATGSARKKKIHGLLDEIIKQIRGHAYPLQA